MMTGTISGTGTKKLRVRHFRAVVEPEAELFGEFLVGEGWEGAAVAGVPALDDVAVLDRDGKPGPGRRRSAADMKTRRAETSVLVGVARRKNRD